VHKHILSEVSLWRRERLREMVLVEADATTVVAVAVRTLDLKEEEDADPLIFWYT